MKRRNFIQLGCLSTVGVTVPLISEALSSKMVQAYPESRYISLRSINYPDRFIRHSYFLGELTPIVSNSDKQDASFLIVTGLADNNSVTLRSVNFPSHVLRHQGFRIKLHEYNPGLIPPPELGGPRPDTPEVALLRKDATFAMIPGLADSSGVSFRSLNYPDRFIRHRDFHLFLEPANSDLARKDATFQLIKPFYVPPSPKIN